MMRLSLVSAVFVLLSGLTIIVGCNSTGDSTGKPPSPLAFEDFTLGMSMHEVDAILQDRKWIKVGTYEYGDKDRRKTRYDLETFDPKPPLLNDITRVQLIAINDTLLSIEVVTAADGFLALKQSMKSRDEELVAQFGNPERFVSIDDLQRAQISNTEPLTLSVWRVDPPNRLVTMMAQEELGQPFGHIHYVDLKKRPR
jgi:hypothetical protein